MFTECPDCQTAFRLTAQVLRQAQGRVRCGGCGNVFNALDHVSEEMPGEDLSNTQVARAFEEQSRELLEALGDLSRDEDDVVIEDTGVEWRVIGEDEPDGDDGPGAADVGAPLRWTFTDAPREGVVPDALEDDAEQAALDLGGDVDPGDMRFDDNTPLPDSFYRPVTATAGGDRPDAGDAARPPPTDERRVDLELGDDDWQDLLDEVGDDDAVPDQRVAGDAVPDLPPAAATDSERVADQTDERPDDAGSTEDDDEEEDAAARSSISFQLVDDEAADDGAFEHPANADEPSDDDAPAASPDDEIDRQLLEAAEAAAARDAGDTPAAEHDDSMLVETIIMEGDTITDRLVDSGEIEVPIEINVQEPEAPAADEPDRSLPRFLLPAAVVLLGLALGAQLVHANRDRLATLALFERTVAPVYDVLGQPVTPAWNVRGWQFQSTDGSTDAAGERLTIRSRIANRSDEALPYPLVHLSLTDRFDDVIGSRILGPNDYLAGTAGPGARVTAGGDFTAVITVDGPAPEATGFKLNVCYPLAGDRLRCAIEDFRN